jgi:hypothetical protein
MLRRIIGIAGISLWGGLIVFAVATGLKSAGDNVEPAKKAAKESGIEPASIETQAKDLVSALSSGEYKEAVKNFDETMKKVLPAEKLQQVWNSIIAQSGPFVEQAGTRKEKILLYNVIFVTCKFENAVLDAKVVFDHNKQIAGLFFVPSQSPINK